MSILIRLLPHNLPTFIRHEILEDLFDATAEAFGCPSPPLDDLAFDEYLKAYALFTRDQAEKALRSGRDTAALKTLLYQNAYPLGGKLRKWFDIDSLQDVMELGQILYRAIGVDIAGDVRGNLTVERCFFSQFYSAPVCDLISALDEGVFAGLSGGGRLAFSERLTEGRPRCKAKLLYRSE